MKNLVSQIGTFLLQKERYLEKLGSYYEVIDILSEKKFGYDFAKRASFRNFLGTHA